MTKRHKSISMSEEQLREYNLSQIEKAKIELENILVASIKRGLAGAMGIRVPLQRGKLGNLRIQIEKEVE